MNLFESVQGIEGSLGYPDLCFSFLRSGGLFLCIHAQQWPFYT